MIMNLSGVKDWIKSYEIAEHYYVGKLDNKQEKSIGIYQGSLSGHARECLGGFVNNGYEVKSVSLLIHWNNNAKETEDAAIDLFQKLRSETNIQISGIFVHFLTLTVAEPQDVGTDDNGVYERVITFDLYYKKEEEE